METTFKELFSKNRNVAIINDKSEQFDMFSSTSGQMSAKNLVPLRPHSVVHGVEWKTLCPIALTSCQVWMMLSLEVVGTVHSVINPK